MAVNVFVIFRLVLLCAFQEGRVAALKVLKGALLNIESLSSEVYF